MVKEKSVYFHWMLESVEKILQYSHEIDMEAFERENLVHDACLMQFQHLGETASKLKSNFPEENSLPYQQMVGFRNFIAHDYVGIELIEVYDTIVRDLPPLKTKLERLIRTNEALKTRP